MEIANFYVVGLNYKNLELGEREKFIKNNPKEFALTLKRENFISGYVVIITCLRIEFYIQLSKNHSISEVLERISMFRENIYTNQGEDAVKYLFKVTCGLDSIIVGEDQILSQIKKTYLKALEDKETCSEINKIFNNAISVGKKFRAESGVASNPLSLEGIATRFIKSHFDRIDDKKVFLIGTGDLSQALLYIFRKEGVKDIIITNRTTHKSRIVKQKFDVETVEFEKKYEVINNSDIIVSATSAPHYIIKFNELKNYLNIEKPRFFLDLAVPRDIEEEVKSLKGVNLYNLDDLWTAYNNNVEKRSEISEKHLYLLDEQLKECNEWFEKRRENFFSKEQPCKG
jgi:glutamyl-tRNA reductase